MNLVQWMYHTRDTALHARVCVVHVHMMYVWPHVYIMCTCVVHVHTCLEVF